MAKNRIRPGHPVTPTAGWVRASMGAEDVKSAAGIGGTFKVRNRSGQRPPHRYGAPSFRVDIDRPVDLIEEVARLWGIQQHIPVSFPVIPSAARAARYRSARPKADSRQGGIMVGFGFAEVVNYSFIGADQSCSSMRSTAGCRHQPKTAPFRFSIPLSQDQAVMRTSSGARALTKHAPGQHLSRQDERPFSLFETGKVFLP